MLLFIAVLFTLWLAASAMAGEVSGPRVRGLAGGAIGGLPAGETIEVLHKKQAERIRLSGIDCPEKGQPFEEKATHATSALVIGKEVTVQMHGKDKDRHTLAEVVLSDGTNVSKMLVAGGWCWWYPKYALQSRELKRLP